MIFIGGIFIKYLKIFFGLVICLGCLSACNEEKTYKADTTFDTEPPKVEKVETKTIQTQTNSKDNNDIIDFQNKYTIYLDIITEEKKVNAIEKISFVNKTSDELDKIFINTYLNAFDDLQSQKPYFTQFENKIFKYGHDIGNLKINSVTMDNEDLQFVQEQTYFYVIMPKAIKPNAKVDLTITFEAQIPNICHRTGYNDYAMWFGNFIPTIAEIDKDGVHNNRYYPAGDPFYSTVSSFDVYITVPKGYTVIGSGIPNVNEKEGNIVYYFDEDMIRDFSFAVSDRYNKISKTTDNGIIIQFYYYSDIKQPERFLDAAQKSIEYCSEKIGTYPYKSYSIVETELFGEIGMEYPEVVFMDSDYLHKDASVNSLVHETAHQWFYNIIGNNQVKEAWIDEGLVSLIQEYALGKSDQQIKEIMDSAYSQLQNVIDDMNVTTLNSDISQFQSWSNYYYIDYVKAKLMFYNLRNKIGSEKFDQFLKHYYNKYAFKVVSKENIIEAFNEVSEENLDSFFDDWLNSSELPKEE